MKFIVNLFIFSFFNFFILESFSEKVPVDIATKVAKNFYYHNYLISNPKSTIRNPQSILLDSPRLVYYSSNPQSKIRNSQSSDSTLVCYIFYCKTPGGFVIVSADDNAIPVLGYSFEGNYDTLHYSLFTIHSFNAWMEGYKKQIAYLKTRDTLGKIENKSLWYSILDTQYIVQSRNKSLKSTVLGPLLSNIAWGQDCPYNQLCPSDNKAGSDYCFQVPTGCVATAMAQVMRYWYYPARGDSSHTYTSSYGSLSANFGNDTYDWENMPYSISKKSSVEQKNAVAKLMYDCGVAVDMDYGSDGSSSYPTAIPLAFSGYFKYSKTATLVYKYKYSYKDWVNLLKGQLNVGRPVIYGGVDQNNEGHAFVCDGYNSEDYFHFNWGWDGLYNGYFTLTNLTPDKVNNFANQEEAIINIFPDYAIQGSGSVCAGQSDSKFQAPYFKAYNYDWTVTGGQIISGTGSSDINVSWNDKGKATLSVKIYFDKGSSFNKYVISEKDITINDNPQKSVVKIKDGNILICTDASVDHYQWYYKGNLLQNDTRQFYIPPKPFDNNGPFWVITSYYDGCSTESYHYPDPLINTDFIVNTDSIFLYSLPGDNYSIHISVNGIAVGNMTVNAFDATGKKINSFSFSKENYNFTSRLGINAFPPAFVIIEVLFNNKRVVKKGMTL